MRLFVFFWCCTTVSSEMGHWVTTTHKEEHMVEVGQEPELVVVQQILDVS